MPHTFITQDELVTYIFAYAWIVPTLIILCFFVIYRIVLLQRIKDEIKKRKNLTDIKHRSNGHHKTKEKVK